MMGGELVFTAGAAFTMAVLWGGLLLAIAQN